MVKKKKKAQVKPEAGSVEPVAEVAEAGKKKKKLKRREVQPEVPAPIPVIKKLKKKKKKVLLEQGSVAQDEPTQSNQDTVSINKRKSSEGVEGNDSAPPTKKLKKKKKRPTGEAAPEAAQVESKEADGDLSEADSFFAGEKDKKLEDRGPKKEKDQKDQKVPDHLNPMKVFVGGLPWAVTEDTVRADFSECGEIERFDMPLNGMGKPSGNAYIYYKTEEGVLAALEFHGTDYQGRTLKVMRAERQKKDGEGKGKDGKGKSKDKDGKGKDGNGNNQQDYEKPRNDETTVFVGGLSYDTEYDTLKKDFEECGEVTAVRMVNDQEGKFRGIAFVVYKDDKGVEAALKFDGDDYGGRRLKVSKASEKPRNDKGKGKDGKGKDGKDGKGKDGKDGKGKKGKDGKGKGKGGGKEGGGGKGICYKFQSGSCPFGDACIFSHDA